MVTQTSEKNVLSFRTRIIKYVSRLFLLIVHTWNSSPLRSNLLRLKYTCCIVPTTSGRPHGSPFRWACQWPSSQPLLSPQLSHNIFEIHQLWKSGFSRVYSNSCSSCSFEPEIIRIGQSSHMIYSNKILNFQVSLTILNAGTKKVWKLIEGATYIICNIELFGKKLYYTQIITIIPRV